ncbi:uncharacterized protein ASPGLDRAFT_36808 [Aspergillus glaucus CBS 516.65]|uniref:AMP-dependent synthetase/ligase domain-containing protein n=1 Tax=Aspergillus glaucus CBS 516.65 TaxID=1160497 RepID=A0A1L9VFJ4_ASPGL|nr:hypothetical protein ASPGLDRAFT_36808 [Aspergillus glaucus CBS 516.65]OJJ82686.1 hypothetical protein ASPGLDRAFT_36808 [Aspergillus glaucus CBS 516.65]
MADLAGAVNYTAWWIERTIGRGNPSEPLAYMGARDLRYTTFAFACMKTGHSVSGRLCSSPLPEIPRRHFCMSSTRQNLQSFFFSAEQQKVVEQLQQANKNLQSWEVPGLWEVFDKKVDCYPFVKQYADVEDEAPIIIHSSGTTGFPKPIYLTNGFWSVMDNNSELPVPEGRKEALMNTVKPGGLFFMMAPFFHLMGLVCFVESICHNTPFFLSPEKPMTVELLARIIDENHPVTSLLTPSVIEDIGSSPQGLDLLRRFEVIFFGGAPLSPKIGAGFVASLAPVDRNEWAWFEWNPYAAVDMQYAVDGAYELVLCRTETRDFSAIFHTFPELKEYRAKDLFVPYPTKAGLWRYHG